MTDSQDRSGVKDLFRGVLDRHGYGFQYAVIRRIQEIFKRQQAWLLEASEFPTTIGGQDTRIDFIVRPRGTRFFLVAECKRANPALSNWCFARAPYIRRGRTKERLFAERVTLRFPDDGKGKPTSISVSGVSTPSFIENAFHIAVEVRDPQSTGDPGGGKNAIEAAAGQALRGVNGLVGTLARISHPAWETSPKNPLATTLMPAIFTTARLWTTSADLGAADLSTGRLSPDTFDITELPWLFWQYPVSPGLKHSFPSETEGYEFADLLDPEYMRTIAIISSSGIDKFFGQFLANDDWSSDLFDS